MVQITKKQEKLVLIDNPLTTKNRKFLEDILDTMNGYKYLNAVQYGSFGGNFGIPSNSKKEPIGKYLQV